MRFLFPLAAVAAAAIVATPTFAQPVESPSARLRALFTASDEAGLKRNPFDALFRGDMRYADQLGDFFSDAALAAERAAVESDLASLATIDRAALTPAEQISFDVFKWDLENRQRGLEPEIVALTSVRPLDHFNGIHTFIPELHSGDSAVTYKTLDDHRNSLSRLATFAFQIDMAIARFRQGQARGIVHPRLIVTNMIDQLDTMLTGGTEASVMMKPIASLPAGLSAEEARALRADYTRIIGGEVNPALARLRAYLKTDYLPAARDSVGLGALPGGDRLYEQLITSNTTTTMTADEIHALGLSEVARIRAGMEAVKARTGFKGDLPAFFRFLRTDPRFQPKSKEDLAARFKAVGTHVDARVGALFSLIPKAPLRLSPVPAASEKTYAAGAYLRGTPDGSRPGTFLYNTYDLPSRTTPRIETLYLHEAIPGHHFQISLAQEDEKLPPFQRFGGNTAYIEGWALYAESLGPELGLFKDPYALQGHYDDEMLRALRLVVDTGLHAKGWSRDKAIDYMLENSATSRTEATAEVERYIAYPGQALAYKIGALTIRRLRTRAEQALGPKFDIRAFHKQILEDGALPLTVLEAKIGRWIEGQKG
ncbi:DUF885 domain-containing protein [Polymorphobacter sp.]|uniref:DUF885 domain-containing protein n=1 Tax=Polymorphobacter sp. TaxID=1909290 RepID=UPI003F72D961